MRIITLTTDFGLKDPFVGIMKGVILSISPDARLVDLTHDVEPHDVVAGALALESAVPFFPAGTIHLGVVDPGVGTDQRAIAIRCGGQFFVGPDNGLFDLAISELSYNGSPTDRKRDEVRIVQLTNADFFREPISDTFHGRDVFAPVAAHLASGLAFDDLADGADVPVESLARLHLVPLKYEGSSACFGEILACDRFGNMITNVRQSDLPSDSGMVRIEFDDGSAIDGLSRTFGDVASGGALAYFGSAGRLEIGVREGSAKESFGLHPGSTFRLCLH